MRNKSVEKPHFIVKDIQDDFHMNWCGKLIDADPIIQDGKPIFVIIGSQNRLELNTLDFNYIEKCAKRMTNPKGKQAETFDSARIYIKEKNGNEMLMGILSHLRSKTFIPVQNRKTKNKKA